MTDNHTLASQLAGIINVNKPKGWTSFQVVALVRRLSGVRRVGHGGTLDPLATGVLPVALGQATRLVEYIQDTHKVYRAEICLGATTDTYDAEGTPVASGDFSTVTHEQVVAALASFVGEIDQRPPSYSAVKQAGVPLYRHARAGRAVEASVRQVSIYRIDLLDFALPLITIEVECGSGTYIRSLANDLGQILGCGSYLAELIRTRVGPFDVMDAVTPDDLREAAQNGELRDLIQPPDILLGHSYAAILGLERAKAVCQGKDLHLADSATTSVTVRDGDICRAYSTDGELIALLRYQAATDRWHPAKVFKVIDTS